MTPAEPLILVNGSPAASVSPLDRGLAFGDGVFRTLRMERGEPVWWNDHLEKLAADCRRLGIEAPMRMEWEQDLAWIAARQPDSVIKLVVTRGPGPRGYRLPDRPMPTRLVQASPMPDFPDPVLATGASVRVCDLRLGFQPRLAGAKHLNRLENVLARMEWDDPAIDEGILLDTDGNVVSGVMSNLFIRIDGNWSTPLIDRCGVTGVSRARLMRKLEIRESRFGIDTLMRADSILLSNSLIRLRWVSSLAGNLWGRPEDFDKLMEIMCSSD